MLTIMRRPNESILIGDDIVVTVLERDANRVLFGIDAPPDVAVHREELYEKIQQKLAEQDQENSTDE